ncbi:MAG: hypothetical protein ACPGOY_08170 [Rhodospirillaceae bacterium]
MTVWLGKSFIGLLVFGGLAACSAAPGVQLDDPIERKVKWYSTLNGDDIRARCAAGGSDEVRLIMNAVYSEHVRIHTLRPGSTGSGLGQGQTAVMDSRIIGETDLTALAVDLTDLLGPGRGVDSKAAINAEQLAAIMDGLEASGLSSGGATPATLRGASHYWVASACRSGAYSFAAWRVDDGHAGSMAFVKPVLAADPSGILVPVYQRAVRGGIEERRREQFDFVLEAGPEGLLYLP